MADKMLTTGQVAKMTGYCARTVCSWFDTGIITGYRVPGGLDRRISERSLRAMAARLGMPLNELEPRERKGRKCNPASATKDTRQSPSSRRES